MRILVTGGAGFIGSACVRRLTADGHACVVLDSFDTLLYARPLKERNLAWARQAGEVPLVEGDVRDAQLLRDTFANHEVDVVLHLAALAGVRPSIAHAERYYDVNVTGTQRVLTAARTAGVSRFVLASSSSVYGANEKTPFAESDPVDQPVSPYAASKRAMEILCGTDQALHGGDLTCLRFFTVYGPRQRPEMAIHKFMRLIAAGSTIPMFGDGSTGRDYTFIDDIVDGVVRAITRSGTEGGPAARGPGGTEGGAAARGPGGMEGGPAARGPGGTEGGPAARGPGGTEGGPAADRGESDQPGPRAAGPHEPGPRAAGPHEPGPRAAGPHEPGPRAAGPHEPGPRAAGPHGFRVYNLGGDQVVLLLELIDAIGEVVGKTPRIEQLELQPGDVPLTNADLTRSRAELGYQPQTPLREGLAEMWRWFNDEDG